MTIASLLLALAVLASGPSIVSGDANFAEPSHGSHYLAMRLDRGTAVTVCGAGGCREMITTDYGPARRTGDVAGIGLESFAAVCGWTIAKARRMGECPVRITIGERVRLPATDTE